MPSKAYPFSLREITFLRRVVFLVCLVCLVWLVGESGWSVRNARERMALRLAQDRRVANGIGRKKKVSGTNIGTETVLGVFPATQLFKDLSCA
jgi:hypothetical protein